MRKKVDKVEEWSPAENKRNPCLSPLVEPYITFVSKEHTQVGVPVKQAGPMLAHTLGQSLQGM